MVTVRVLRGMLAASAIAAAAAGLAACGKGPTAPSPPVVTPPAPQDPTPQPSPTAPPSPTLSVTSFVAFGDSMTVGVIALRAPTFSLMNLTESQTYPFKLQLLLATRYTAQSPIVVNAGQSGEWAQDGVKRLPGVLAANHPEVLLLMEGVNDLVAGKNGIPRAADAVETMVKIAQRAGMKVLLATVPPQRPGGSRAETIDLVPLLNAEIVKTAASQGATLVDVNRAFGTDYSLLSADGLHPSEAGYERIAATFFERIHASFEVPASTLRQTLTSPLSTR